MVAGADGSFHEASPLLAAADGVLVVQLGRRAPHIIFPVEQINKKGRRKAGERGKSESASEVIEGGGEKARSGDGDGDGDSGGEGGAGGLPRYYCQCTGYYYCSACPISCYNTKNVLTNNQTLAWRSTLLLLLLLLL